VSADSLSSYLMEMGADIERPSVRLYVEQFVRGGDSTETPDAVRVRTVPARCSATSPPDFVCELERDHKPTIHHWSRR
jgi:hypothetical protein